VDRELRKLERKAAESGAFKDWERYRLASLRAGYCIVCENIGEVCSRCGPLSLCECQCYCCGSELVSCDSCSPHGLRRNPDDKIRQLYKEWLTTGDSMDYQAYESASLRAGVVPLTGIINAIKQLETQAKDQVIAELQANPSYRPPAANQSRWDQSAPGSVMVTYTRRYHYPQFPTSTRVTLPRRGSSFHLEPCGQCHCPSWQQPCPYCGWYPMGRESIHNREPAWDCEQCVRRIGKRNFYEFYAHSLAANRVEEYQPIANRIRDVMLELGAHYQWPSNEEICAMYGYLQCAEPGCVNGVRRVRYTPEERGYIAIPNNIRCRDHGGEK